MSNNIQNNNDPNQNSNQVDTMKTVLITGASAGLGEECARQLACQRTTIQRIILGCRSEERARAAKNRLEARTGRKVFEIVIIDLTHPDSVKRAVNQLNTAGGPIDGLVLNAGGKGGKEHTTGTEFGVPLMVAANVTGHVLLVDLLLQQGKLSDSATVIYSGSEAARGSPLFGIPKPVIKKGTVEEFTALCDGTYYGKDNTSFEVMYGRTKLLGSLWMAYMARQHQSMRFVTMSPGATTGTNFLSDFSASKKFLAKTLMPMLMFFGVMHSLDKGAKRYVDALTEEALYSSGIFYGSRSGGTGKVVDQVKFMPQLHNETCQENANTAIHKFVPSV